VEESSVKAVQAAQPAAATDLDVLIVGAGLSGIGAAYHLQTNCPGKTYAILEARETLGGTWDLFRYPGIRSDSDMYTLGYSFRPWTNPKAIADGPSILGYVRDTAVENGIDRHIRFGHRVEAARWSSEHARWTLDAREVATGRLVHFTCKFVYVCSGYYDYEAGYTPEFAGRDRFQGTFIHPQRWPADADYAGKRVVVIGSGATAVTLVPELAKDAAHVTMLQRTPTYVVSRPAADGLANWLRERLPETAVYDITRWKNVLVGMAFYAYCRRFPEQAKKLLVKQVSRHVRSAPEMVEHFTPTYNPWDQRMCLVPDGDLFRALRKGKASVVTDHIETFVENGIQLRSGKVLEADVIVSATGLQLKFMGGMHLDVDGVRVDPSKSMTYKAMMLSGVPNLAFALGYTNASWTLKCDLTSNYVCRLLEYMTARGYAECRPRADASVEAVPSFGLASGYVQRGIHLFPQQGSVAPWRLYQNYAIDRVLLRRQSVEDRSMEFRRARAQGGRPAPASNAATPGDASPERAAQ
jgi:cation diffusion facilitator CzcD-associated flavoprotein CzcO